MGFLREELYVLVTGILWQLVVKVLSSTVELSRMYVVILTPILFLKGILGKNTGVLAPLALLPVVMTSMEMEIIAQIKMTQIVVYIVETMIAVVIVLEALARNVQQMKHV